MFIVFAIHIFCKHQSTTFMLATLSYLLYLDGFTHHPFLEWRLCNRASNFLSRLLRNKGAFTNYVDRFMTFFDHLPPYVDIFYLINVDKKSTFLDSLPTSSYQRSLWTPPNVGFVIERMTLRLKKEPNRTFKSTSYIKNH